MDGTQRKSLADSPSGLVCSEWLTSSHDSKNISFTLLWVLVIPPRPLHDELKPRPPCPRRCNLQDIKGMQRKWGQASDLWTAASLRGCAPGLWL